MYDLVVATRDLAQTLLQRTSLNEDFLDYESETAIRPIHPDTGMLVGEEDQSISSFSSTAEETSPASAHPITTVNSSNTLSTAYVPPALRKMQCSGAFELNPEKGRLKEEWEAWQKSGRHSEMRGIRANLSAYKYRGDVQKAFNSCSVTSLWPAGCGKSTQVHACLSRLYTSSHNVKRRIYLSYFTTWSCVFILCNWDCGCD
jgi:HrpA-like RNA helicase